MPSRRAVLTRPTVTLVLSVQDLNSQHMFGGLLNKAARLFALLQQTKDNIMFRKPTISLK
jgi:hypothetical protein